MMTVAILVNNQPLYTRTIHRIINEDEGNGKRCYELDDGSRIWHDPKDGILELAKQALDTIEQVGIAELITLGNTDKEKGSGGTK